MRANGIESALKNSLSEGFLQVGLDAPRESRVIADKGDTTAAHYLAPYRILGCRPRGTVIVGDCRLPCPAWCNNTKAGVDQCRSSSQRNPSLVSADAERTHQHLPAAGEHDRLPCLASPGRRYITIRSRNAVFSMTASEQSTLGRRSGEDRSFALGMPVRRHPGIEECASFTTPQVGTIGRTCFWEN